MKINFLQKLFRHKPVLKFINGYLITVNQGIIKVSGW